MTNDRIKTLEHQVKNLSRSVETMLENSIAFYDTPGSELIAKAYGGSATGDTRRLNQLENRLNKMEARLENVSEELGEAIVTFSEARQSLARHGEAAGLDTLAKAASGAARQATPEGVLGRAQRAIADPTTYGVVESYVRDGQLAKAASIVENAERADVEDGEDAALNRVESQIKEHTLLATVSELGGQVSSLEQTVKSLLQRLTQLERRPAPAPVQPTVAKAVGRRGTTPYADTPAGLMTRVEAAFDDPGTVGTYSSMLQSKDAVQIEQVRMAVEAQELHHESRNRRNGR